MTRAFEVIRSIRIAASVLSSVSSSTLLLVEILCTLSEFGVMGCQYVFGWV